MNSLSSDLPLSLKEKLSQHWEKKKANMVANNMKLFNITAPAFLHIVFLGATPWTMFEVLPTFYGDSWAAIIAVEAFTVYGFVQVMTNWILLWQTDSTYDPDVHGVELSRARVRAAVRDNESEHWFNGATETKKLVSKTNGSEFESSEESWTPNPPSTTDGETYQVYVATAITKDGVERQAMPYWSWAPCLICQKPRPPRCHHCALCKCCVLKRDHHCFFGRNCVGFNNQRYFVFFLVWSAILTSWGAYMITPYVFRYILPHYSYWDYVFPVNVARALLGYLPLIYLHLTTINLGVFVLLVFSSTMLTVHLNLMLRGLTSFEYDANVKVGDTRPLAGRLRSVLGRNWGLSLLLPGYTSSAPLEDPVYWPDIKIS